MKSARKLIPALVMLLVSAIVMSSASFAWFSMNKEVTATGMQITAKSNSIFLLINDTGTAAEGNDTIPLAADVELYPAALEGTDPTVTKWYTAAGTARNDATLKEGTKEQLTALNFEKYVLKKTVYLTLTTGSAASGALTVVGTTFVDNIGEASKIAFAVGDVVKGTMTKANMATPIALADSVTASDCVKVDIYYYFDGNDTDITTDKFAAGTLTTSNVELKFAVADPTP